MKQTVHESIAKIKKVFLVKNMPLGITVAFTRLVRKAAGITEGLAACQCQEANKASEFQSCNSPWPSPCLTGDRDYAHTHTGSAHIPQGQTSPRHARALVLSDP